MQTTRTKRFQKQLSSLPQSIQSQFDKQELLFTENHRHPSLHFKKLVDKNDVYSIRIGGSYRALFILADDVCIFFAIGHRKDIYRS